ncbi:MAG: phage major capsid protein, P2 family [Roseateles depolymerans]|uniref:Phage major capsid protein, P2 family n=1 Tax=Roseateles depolymerans TaxID=76731 RepID=A0A2W5FLP6_9BURK|nr:MAG: phage major capsid protein, P2 family [Roseateles depolymerans]
MRNETRLAFTAYLARIAQLSAVASATHTFAVDPTVQQTLETKIQESSDFLNRINIIGVAEMEGEKLGLGISGPIASRTNTAVKDRATRDLSTLDQHRYKCAKTNFDTHLGYAKLDAWAKFPDFQNRIRDAILTRQALDRIMIGFNGTSIAAETDPVANPMLQDVNIGWLQHMRDDAAARVMKEGSVANKVRIGEDGDYKNLDAAVFDAVQLLDPWYQQDPGLVAILGRDLMHDKLFPLVNDPKDPSERLAADVILSQKRVGGLAAATVPFIPPKAILITRFDNLSIYFQEGARRRRVEDNAKRDRIENYESSNDAFVVEDYGLAALVENIEFV